MLIQWERHIGEIGGIGGEKGGLRIFFSPRWQPFFFEGVFASRTGFSKVFLALFMVPSIPCRFTAQGPLTGPLFGFHKVPFIFRRMDRQHPDRPSYFRGRLPQAARLPR